MRYMTRERLLAAFILLMVLVLVVLIGSVVL